MLFDEQGTLLKLIRMTLVQFIRVTYGSTINREVRRYIVCLFQEECIVKYLIMLRDAFWPKTSPIQRQRNVDEDKHERRQHAKRQLLTNIPGIYQERCLYKKIFDCFFLETISLIFGSDNARLGAERLFELFQDIRLNKHLCYVRNRILNFI
jgi:sorting nexin-25